MKKPQTLAEFIFSRVEVIPRDMRDRTRLQEMVTDYVIKAVKSKGAFFQKYEIALVNREEEKRAQNQSPRFNAESYLSTKSGLFQRNMALRLREVLIGNAIQHHPDYNKMGGLALTIPTIRHFKLIYMTDKKLGEYIQSLFDIKEGQNKKKTLHLKKQYADVVLKSESTFATPIEFDGFGFD